MRRVLHIAGRVGATIVISMAAGVLLALIKPDRAITLLIYLPGIVVADALFGVWCGLLAVLLSVAGSAGYRILYLPQHVQLGPYARYQTWEEEIILLLVGLFVVVLIELGRQSSERAASVQQQLMAIMENVSDAVVVFGSDLRVRSLNRAALTMLNRPGETVVGETADSLKRRFTLVRTGASGPDTRTLAEASRGGVAQHEEGTILDVGQQRTIEVIAHSIPWMGRRREVEGVVVVISDLTATKELQVRLLESARQLAVGQMFSGLSHDFNHSLDIIRRSLAVLEMHENAPTEERRRYRDMIDRAAVEGSQIVRRLRDYMAGGAGVQTEVNLARVAQEALELTRPLWRTRALLEVRAELEPVPAVLGNAQDLQRVLVNLIFNAIEALGAKAGWIRVHTEAAGDRVRAWVEDNGPGIAPEQQARVFDPYYTTKPQGMGLGLFGAGQIARAHGGTLTVSSRLGEGARFTLELPRLHTAGGEAARGPASGSPSAAA